MAKSPAWQRKEGKNPSGGLNAKGVASVKKWHKDNPEYGKKSSMAKKRR